MIIVGVGLLCRKHDTVSDSMLTHYDSRVKQVHPFKCESCGKVYNYKHDLNRHLKYICGKEAQFLCPFCPQKCKLKFNLRTHIVNKHSGLIAIDNKLMNCFIFILTCRVLTVCSRFWDCKLCDTLNQNNNFYPYLVSKKHFSCWGHTTKQIVVLPWQWWHCTSRLSCVFIAAQLITTAVLKLLQSIYCMSLFYYEDIE